VEIKNMVSNRKTKRLCKTLKDKFGKQIRDLAEMGIAVEAGMHICGGKGKKALEPTSTGDVTLGSREQIFSPKGIPENCGDRLELGQIHTHVAETRAGEEEEYLSKLSVDDLHWSMRDRLDFICAVRKGKMKCADLTGLLKSRYEQTKAERELSDDISNAWREGYAREKARKDLPTSWFKLAKSIDERIPQCEIEI